jgi:hypothetical protein
MLGAGVVGIDHLPFSSATDAAFNGGHSTTPR